jgi:hypothetical protein
MGKYGRYKPNYLYRDKDVIDIMGMNVAPWLPFSLRLEVV